MSYKDINIWDALARINEECLSHSICDDCPLNNKKTKLCMVSEDPIDNMETIREAALKEKKDERTE